MQIILTAIALFISLNVIAEEPSKCPLEEPRMCKPTSGEDVVENKAEDEVEMDSTEYGEVETKVTGTIKYVDISKFDIKKDIRYDSKDNFMCVNVYKGFNTPYLHPVAAAKFEKAVAALKKVKPKWKFVVFDALRPRSIQHILWKKVEGTEDEGYVADPNSITGSKHNYGFAIDLSLVDENEDEVDMGTPYDSFQKLAQPKLEEYCLKEGKLTEKQLENRKLLRAIMVDAGFTILQNEWWHFDALSIKQIKANPEYKIVETIEELTK